MERDANLAPRRVAPPFCPARGDDEPPATRGIGAFSRLLGASSSGLLGAAAVERRLQRDRAMYRTPPDRPNDGAVFWRELLQRWFVQYNPVYLVSAMLVLGGMITLSRGLAHEESLSGLLGVALIAELYAGSLIGGAALLVRIGQRRPAVMLALLTVLYQADLTLHTETCALLGGVGAAAATAWLALFVGKLYALAWALRVRLARRAVMTAAVGAAGVALAPHLLGRLDARAAGGAVALFVFVLGSLLPHRAAGGTEGADETLTSLVPLDDWGRVVLRRSVRAAWLMWAVLLGLHVLFWSTQHPIQLAAVVPALVVLAALRVGTQLRVWGMAGALVTAAFVAAPRPPRTQLEWGGVAVALGFLLLAASLAASYRLRRVDTTPR